MKRLLIFFLLLFSLARGEAQTTTTSDRVVTKSLYLRDWWVDSVKRDTNFLGAARSIPTAAAVYNFVAGRGAPGYTSVTSLPDSSGLVFHGPNGVQDTVVFEGETASGGVTQATLDDSTSVLRDSINALRADIGSGGGGASTTSDLTDVSDAAPANNTVLTYNQDSGKYVPTAVAAYNLTSPANGDLLKYQDGQWVNFTPDYGTGSSEYDSIAVTGTTDRAAFEFRPSDTALLVTYGGTTFSFKQGGAGGSTATQLSVPGSFSAVAASSSQINLTWSDVANESNYEIQRSTSYDYAGATTINSPAAGSTSYSSTGLSASTQYYYRIRAVGDGTTYSSSPWATASATTSAGGGSGPTAIVPIGSAALTESPSGTYSASGGTTFIFNKSIPAGSSGYVQIDYEGGKMIMIALDTDNNQEGYQGIKHGLYVPDDVPHYRVITDGGPHDGDTNITATPGHKIRLNVVASGGLMTVTAEYSADGGTTWTVFDQLYQNTAVTLYVKGQFISGTAKLVNPKGEGLQ